MARRSANVRIGVVIHTNLRDTLFTKKDMARLETLGTVAWSNAAEKTALEEAVRMLADCEIGIGSWGTPSPASAELMAACPKLRLWIHVAGSVKNMFGPQLKGRGLTIATCKTAIADNVAEMALAEIILGARKAVQNAAQNRAGKCGKPAGLKVLGSCTVGVIGASEVGRRVIRLLRPFGCTVLLYDPYVSAAQAKELGVVPVADLIELCSKSDVVSLHTPLTTATTKMLGAKEFAAMRADATFVNTSRGQCIDEAALAAELEGGRLFAFLDVTDPEPAAGDSPLRSLPNVFLTSHIAGPAGFNMGTQAVDDVARFLRGEKPMCVVTEDQLDHIA